MRVAKQLTAEEIETLRLLVGELVTDVYAEGIDVYSRTSVAPYVVHRFGGTRLGQFLVIESDWSDTKEEAIDFHELHVAMESRPRQIPWKLEPQGNAGGTVHWPFSTFAVTPGIQIAEITVLQREESGSGDSVLYDAALVLRGQDDREFAIFAHQSIAGGVELSLDPETVADLKRECAVRVRVS